MGERRPSRILVVDDNATNRLILARSLERAGYDVATVNDGFEAVDAAVRDLPDLILLDVMMPGRTGLEVSRILQDREETADIPIIFVTAVAETEEIVNAFAAGGSDYITKPFRSEEILARVSVHLRLHQAETELRERNQALRTLNGRLEAASHELKALMNEVIEKRACSARFPNESLKRCWHEKNCTKEDCPAHGRQNDLRCWETAGTFCKGEVQGDFARKLTDCKECHIYQDARVDPICDLGETFNDMLAMLEDRQEALERARVSAEDATVAKSAFLANMSHEIRTPMTAILGFAETLLDADLTDQERLRAVHTIRRNGEYLLAIINDILDLSKIEAGKMSIEHLACDPCELIAEVESLVRVRVEAKGVAFNVEYIGPIPATIQSDPTRLRQILINMMGNAVKFTETGGVRLAVRCLRDSEPPRLQFDIEDTGVGMSEEQAGALFQPFMQADPSMVRKFGGTGLGLALSKRFAELLGGTITLLETREGVGTRFRVTVATGPLDGVRMIDNAATAAKMRRVVREPPPVTQRPRLTGCRILLADDGVDNQRLLSWMLEKAGATVTVAANGQEAVQAVVEARDTAAPFHVILMDMQMPVMDGYEASGLLRQKGIATPVIAVTAHAMAGDREKCLQAGCDDYLTKPIDRNKLIEAVQRNLQTAATETAVTP